MLINYLLKQTPLRSRTLHGSTPVPTATRGHPGDRKKSRQVSSVIKRRACLVRGSASSLPWCSQKRRHSWNTWPLSRTVVSTLVVLCSVPFPLAHLNRFEPALRGWTLAQTLTWEAVCMGFTATPRLKTAASLYTFLVSLPSVETRSIRRDGSSRPIRSPYVPDLTW